MNLTLTKIHLHGSTYTDAYVPNDLPFTLGYLTPMQMAGLYARWQYDARWQSDNVVVLSDQQGTNRFKPYPIDSEVYYVLGGIGWRVRALRHDDVLWSRGNTLVRYDKPRNRFSVQGQVSLTHYSKLSDAIRDARRRTVS